MPPSSSLPGLAKSVTSSDSTLPCRRLHASDGAHSIKSSRSSSFVIPLVSFPLHDLAHLSSVHTPAGPHAPFFLAFSASERWCLFQALVAAATIRRRDVDDTCCRYESRPQHDHHLDCWMMRIETWIWIGGRAAAAASEGAG